MMMNIGGEVVPIDCGIADAVVWLNSIPGVRTLFSCEGDTCHCTYMNQPYIAFFASEHAVKIIFNKLIVRLPSDGGFERQLATIELDVWCEKVRYILRFGDRESVDIFTRNFVR